MVKNRISSQYVFGYQKFILYPEDYKTTKSGKKKVLLPELVGKGYGTRHQQPFFWTVGNGCQMLTPGRLQQVTAYDACITTF